MLGRRKPGLATAAFLLTLTTTAGAADRFRFTAEGILDQQQNVLWTQYDNGSDTDYWGAERYCSGKGAGWTLPTTEQLKSLYDASGRNGKKISLGGYNGTIKPASSYFHLSGFMYWSSLPGAAGQFALPMFEDNIYIVQYSKSLGFRALCVRPPLARQSPTPGNRWVAQDDGSVLNTQTRLAWTRRDNGADITWNAARSYCAQRGSGWSLPSMAELETLHDPTTRNAASINMGGRVVAIPMATSLIQPSGIWYWSSETQSAARAFFLNFEHGTRGTEGVERKLGIAYRALCVRRIEGKG